MRLFKDAHYPFMAGRRRAFLASGVLIAIGIISIVLHGGLDYGVDFTGGTLVQLEFNEQVDAADLRSVVEEAGFAGAAIQGFGGDREYLVRLQTFEEVSGEGEVDRMLDALSTTYGEDGYTVLRVAAVGPKVGSELQRKAALAILMSFALTLIYLAFRFEWRFGVAAVIATIHDIVITFGFISLMGIEITLGTVAAILTIVGYSLNDTIVVFDRIRENLRKKRKEPYETTLNRSINETLPRTVLTSGTTLVTLFALFLFGGLVIRPFAMVLILGVLIGTYSSIFVASPALLEIEAAGRRRAKAQRAHAAGA
ncbi:MAG: protein translocase subunit SecF [Gemmatimonadales bacterium]